MLLGIGVPQVSVAVQWPGSMHFQGEGVPLAALQLPAGMAALRQAALLTVTRHARRCLRRCFPPTAACC